MFLISIMFICVHVVQAKKMPTLFHFIQVGCDVFRNLCNILNLLFINVKIKIFSICFCKSLSMSLLIKFRPLIRNVYTSLVPNQNFNYSKDNVEIPSKLTVPRNDVKEKSSNWHRNNNFKSLERLRMIAYQGIRFHEKQIKMHLEELKRHKKNLSKVTELIKNMEKQIRVQKDEK